MTGLWRNEVDHRGACPRTVCASRRVGLLILGTVMLLQLAPSRAAAQTTDAASNADNAPSGNAQNGKTGFADNCLRCHGSEAQGSEGGGPRIGPPPLSFPNFTQFVRKPTGDMPPVSAQRVPDSDLRDIYAYLSTIKAPAETAKAAPTGDAAKGKDGYAHTCSMCHGDNAEGEDTGGPRIGPQSKSFADFAQFVRMPTGDMPPITARRVPDADLADIYAFLQTIAPPAK